VGLISTPFTSNMWLINVIAFGSFALLFLALMALPFAVAIHFRSLRLFRALNESAPHEKALLLATKAAQALVKRCVTKTDVKTLLSAPQNCIEESMWIWSVAPEHVLPLDREPTATELCALPYEGVFLEFNALGQLKMGRFRPLSELACNRKSQSR
jgi:hypothetical protein